MTNDCVCTAGKQHGQRFIVQRDDGIDATMLRKVPVAVGIDVWSETKTIVDNGEAVTLLADASGSTNEFCRICTNDGSEGYIRRAYLEVATRKRNNRNSSGGRGSGGRSAKRERVGERQQ